MSTSTERYVFFNNAADHEAVRKAGAVAAACGAKVVERLPKAILLEVDVLRVPDIAAALADWQFTPERRQTRERRLTPARRAAVLRPAVAAA
ncbi:hypothetical protein J2X20_001254 [Pelomonas saccharophila]|uniref:Uncharacterized protein n=1 Tax=Roseateles saccharophilus TaxID=304 RepID=A0ABU1YK99_ROSSA|nr:hypothetical protein [Roseateles saccharophilus]MDR7268625.1 hypothetical protein [Roseateles saccharophilus]